MKKSIKPLLFISIVSGLLGVMQAQAQMQPSVDYEWLRGAQLNPLLAPTMASAGSSFYVMNPEIGMKQTFVVTQPAVCVASRWRPGVQFCNVGLRDTSFQSNIPVMNVATRATSNLSFSPYIQLSYTQNLSGNEAMNVTDVVVSSLQQIG